jgi:hypothetical protein
VRAKAIGSLLGAATVAASLVPGAAGATAPGEHPASREAKPEVVESFKAPGTNGFTLNVTLLEGKRLIVAAKARAGRQGIKEALYTLAAPQSPGSDDIKARIGGLGKIDVHFVAESTKKAQPRLPGCTGGETITVTGHFVGQISFRGEQGFTRVGATRAVGSVTNETAPKCKNLPTAPPSEAGAEKNAAEAIAEAEGKEVDLNVISDGGKVRLGASRAEIDEKGKSRTFANFTVAAGRNRGKVQEISLVLLFLQKGPTFLSPEPSFPTRAATISPPAPFSGTGTFAREPGKSASWSGDLEVELPGFGDVPLTGEGSKASMCQGPACHDGL